MISLLLEVAICVWIMFSIFWLARKSSIEPKADKWYDYIIAAPAYFAIWAFGKIIK